jgi:selenium metabolism protein YedF
MRTIIKEKEMEETVDARGLACPQPVILTRRALQEHTTVTTIVDNDTARHNVTRMAEKSGAIVQTDEREDGVYLHITREGVQQSDMAVQPTVQPQGGPLVVVVSSETLGRGADELGDILMRAFFHTLGEVAPIPDIVIFANSGVKLVVENSPVLEDLQALAAQDVHILSCGTCLGYFELMEKVAVGEVSNMYTIAETLLSAGKVVSL